jgi:hypothetical protein
MGFVSGNDNLRQKEKGRFPGPSISASIIVCLPDLHATKRERATKRQHFFEKTKKGLKRIA